MKLFSVVLISIVIHLQPVLGEDRIISLGGYRWISTNDNPYVRFTRSGQSLPSLSQLHRDDFVDQKISKNQIQDYLNAINHPILHNEQYSSYPRFPTDKRELDYKMDVKRTNYIRLAKRSEEDFADPNMSKGQIQDERKAINHPILLNEQDFSYPRFPTNKRELDYKMDVKRTNYIRLAKRSDEDFVDPRMSEDQIQGYLRASNPPILVKKEEFLYPTFATEKRSLDHKMDIKRTNYIRLAKKGK